MSSEVDICNLGLSHLGDESQVAAITPPDGTIQAAHCGRFYPIARDALLEMHPWSFATKRVALAEVTNPSPDDWAYAYALPSTCLRPLALLQPGVPEQLLGSPDSDAGSNPYLVETAQHGTRILLTNIQAAYLRYIDQAKDTTKFTPLFVLALARLLASYLAGPILKGDTGMKVSANQMQLFGREYMLAASRDANVGHRDLRQTYQPPWLVKRGLGVAATCTNWA